jgi:acyl-CoA reductase-like NAD-dependent aldehyde dehydrogenase
MKPSERVPNTCVKLVEMLREAGAPDGVVNVIHGTHEAVNFICDHPDIKAISFIGSDSAVSQSCESEFLRPSSRGTKSFHCQVFLAV